MLGLVLCLSFIYVLAVGPMPFFLAQALPVLAWCAADIMFIMGASMSLCKMLFVTHFDLIFCQDPDVLGRRVLSFSFLVGCIPHWVIFGYQSSQGIEVVSIVSYFRGEPMGAEASPMVIYGSVWLIVSLLLLAMAKLFIFNYVKNHQMASVLAAEKGREAEKTISLSKVVVGGSVVALIIIFSVITQAVGLVGDFPVQAPLMAAAICLMLLFFTLDDNVRRFAKEKDREEVLQLKLVAGAVVGYCCRPSQVHPA